MATYTAQNFGAGKFNRIKLGVARCQKFIVVLTIISICIIIFLGRNVVNLFIVGDYPNITHQAQLYMTILCLFYFCLGSILLYRNVLQGMGSVKIPFMSGIIELVIRTVAAFVLAYFFGYLGACFATPCAWIGGAIWLAYGYYKTIKKLSYTALPKSDELSFLNLNK